MAFAAQGVDVRQDAAARLGVDDRPHVHLQGIGVAQAQFAHGAP